MKGPLRVAQDDQPRLDATLPFRFARDVEMFGIAFVNRTLRVQLVLIYTQMRRPSTWCAGCKVRLVDGLDDERTRTNDFRLS